MCICFSLPKYKVNQQETKNHVIQIYKYVLMSFQYLRDVTEISINPDNSDLPAYVWPQKMRRYEHHIVRYCFICGQPIGQVVARSIVTNVVRAAK